MSDAPKITRGIRLPVMTQEEIETDRKARESQRPDPLAGFKAAADAYMRPMAERARDAMDAALAVHRLTMPGDLLTPEERERKEQERRMNELVESSRRNDELLRRRIQDDRARFIRDMAEANAAAMVQARGKSEPVQTGKAEPATLPQDGDRPPQPSQTQARAVELAAVLDNIEARAHECGVPLVRNGWPGTKAEFRAFLEWYAPRLLWALPTDDDRLSDELRPHGVTFGKPGRARDKGKKIYQELFPNYPA